jgi:hypothetical protein
MLRQPSKPCLLAVSLQHLRVENHARLLVFRRDDNQANRRADLRRRQPDAFGAFHHLQHVFNQMLQVGRDALHGLGDLAQQRVGILHNPVILLKIDPKLIGYQDVDRLHCIGGIIPVAPLPCPRRCAVDGAPPLRQRVS